LAKSNFASPYTITISVPQSIIGTIVGIQPVLDGQNGSPVLMGVVNEHNMNAFNKAKVTISISKTVDICN